MIATIAKGGRGHLNSLRVTHETEGGRGKIKEIRIEHNLVIQRELRRVGMKLENMCDIIKV